MNWIETIWQNEIWLIGLGLVSLLSFIVSLFLIQFLVVRIPTDYFAEPRRHRTHWAEQHLLIRWSVLILKNVLGVFFLVLGLLMLFLPGQGLLTVLIGVLLLNFPGKYRFERWLISLPTINRAVSWLRQRAGRAPLRF